MNQLATELRAKAAALKQARLRCRILDADTTAQIVETMRNAADALSDLAALENSDED